MGKPGQKHNEWESLACDPPDSAKPSRGRAEETAEHLRIPWSLQRRPARQGIHNPHFFNISRLCICEVQSQLEFLGQEQHLTAHINPESGRHMAPHLISISIRVNVEE